MKNSDFVLYYSQMWLDEVINSNLLIINQLQNGFIFSGPPIVFYVYIKYFSFLRMFYIMFHIFTN